MNKELKEIIGEPKSPEQEIAIFRDILDMLPDTPILVHDLFGKMRLKYANDAACRHFGMEREALMGSSLFDLDPDLDRDGATATGAWLQSKGPLSIKSRHRTASGELVPVSVVLKPIQCGGLLFGVSIVHRLSSVDQHREQIDFARYLASFEANLPGFLFSCRLNHGLLSVLYVSPSIHEFYGTPPTSGYRIADLGLVDLLPDGVSPDDKRALLEAFERSADGGEIVEVDYRFTHREQGERWMHLRANPLMEGDGSVLWHGFVYDNTERKRMEDELRRQADFQRTLLDAINEVSLNMMLIENGRVIHFNNKKLTREFGLSEEEIEKGVPLLDYIHPDDRARVAETHRRRLAGEQVANTYEFAMLTPRGERREYETYAAIVPGTNPVRTVVIHKDITARKRMEQALARSEHEFRSLAEGSPDSIIRYDRDGRIRYLNSKLERELGATAAELDGRLIHEAWPDGRFAEIEKAVWGAIKEGTVETVVLPIHTPQPRYHQVRVVPERDCAGAIIGALAIGTDVTDILRLQESLAAREQEFRSLAENTPDNIARWDRAGRLLYSNPTHQRTLRKTAAEMIGKTHSELFPDGRFALLDETMARVVATAEEGIISRVQVFGENGETRLHDVKLVPEFDAAGKVVSVLGLGRDMTDVYRMQDAVTQREQEFRSLAENTADIIVRYGTDCRRLYVNPSLSAAYGLPADRLLGTSPSDIPGGESWLRFERKLREVIASRTAADYELVWRDPRGKMQHTLFKMTPEFSRGGELASVLAVGRDITELAEQREKIHNLAFYDLVTGLPNRALFGDRLTLAITDARWHEDLLGVMLLDLDRFKAVNDTLGHNQGDELLRESAARLLQTVRSYDTVARLGGDEFAVLLSEIRDAQSLNTVAEKILAVLSEPFLLDGKEMFIGASIGIALYPSDSDNADGLLKSADLAMYAAKRAGGNGARYYSAELTSQAQERMKLETELRRALERNELELHFQPKVALVDKRMKGSEALLRWNSAKFGRVPPDRFIGIAEDTGMIVKIGAWVLREACLMAKAWNAEGGPLHKVAVNLSPRQFVDGNLEWVVAEALRETRCRPEWIELEITESLLLDNADSVRKTLQGLRAMGFSIALDDFGTGYSALSYLTNFPIDTLKIDRSFINDMLSNSSKAELVKAIIAMARCLEMDTVAEGVETEEQAKFLLEHGCSTGQGYLYGKPMPKHEVWVDRK